MLSSAITIDGVVFPFLGVLLGLAALIVGPGLRRRSRCLLLGLAVLLLAGLAVWPPLSDRASGPWLPPLVLAGACAGCLFLSLPFAGGWSTAVFTLAGRPRVQGSALLVLSSLFLVGWVWSVEHQPASGQLADPLHRFGPTPGVGPEKERTVWTDQGAPLLVYEAGLHQTLPDDEAAEAEMVRAQHREMQLIRTAPPCRDSNCHGWVFTGGRYALSGGDVERILVDNGYHAVSAPQAGDLVSYRDKMGNITHSAVVRVAAPDLILLESKWGNLGRYLHRPEDYRFDFSWTFYRSPRAGHLLQGLDREQPTTPGNPLAARRSLPGEV